MSSSPTSSVGVPGLPERPRQVSRLLAIDIVCAGALPVFFFFVFCCVAFGAVADDADVTASFDDVVVGSGVVSGVDAAALDDDDRSKVTVWRVRALGRVDGKAVTVDSYFDDGDAPAAGATVDLLDDDDGARAHLVVRGGRGAMSGPGGLVFLFGAIVVLGGFTVGLAAGKRADLALLRDGARGFATVKDRHVEPGSGDSSDRHVVTFAYVDEDAGGVAREFVYSAVDVSAVVDDEREAILYRGGQAALVDALPGRPALDGRGRFVSSRPLRTWFVAGCVVVGAVVSAAGVVTGVVEVASALR